MTADSNWRRFLYSALLTAGGLLAAIYTFIVLMNPFGHLPLRLFGPHAIMDINQRFQYPAIARAGIYNLIVIGTSSARLLDPDRLDAVLGGRFANLAMNSAMAWEQSQLAQLFLRHEPRPKRCWWRWTMSGVPVMPTFTASPIAGSRSGCTTKPPGMIGSPCSIGERWRLPPACCCTGWA